MAGVPAGLPAGIRLSDHLSLGVIARTFPPERVRQILAETGKASERERDLPAQVGMLHGGAAEKEAPALPPLRRHGRNLGVRGRACS